MVSPALATATSFTNSRRVISRLLLIVFPRAPSCTAKLHRSFLLTQPNAVTNNLSIIFQSEKPTSMFIHMFAFRLKPGVSEAQQDRMIREIGALKDHIPNVLESYVGKNVSPRGQGYVIGGVMKFESQAALELYNSHPVQQAHLKWLLPLIYPIDVDFPG